jgi:hypothetical protein
VTRATAVSPMPRPNRIRFTQGAAAIGRTRPVSYRFAKRPCTARSKLKLEGEIRQFEPKRQELADREVPSTAVQRRSNNCSPSSKRAAF